ncbi:MAG: ComEC/Rec2 family competence protein [Paracoccaceae bacterium]
MPLSGAVNGLKAAVLHQRGHLLPWAPVGLAIGIGFYFKLRVEPDYWAYVISVSIALGAGLLAWRGSAIVAPFLWATSLIAVGFSIAGVRAHSLTDPVIGWRYYGPIEGRIVGIDRSASDAVRLTLDQVALRDVSATRTPAKVRVSLHGDIRGVEPVPGLRIMTTGHLAPPSGPVEPGGFDFQRHAWFQSLGAVGYTRVPVVALIAPDTNETGLKVLAVRMAISSQVQDVLAGDVGGFAAAVTTGDRSGISQDALDALRASNLAHLLAISGLHMGLLAGFVFAALRIGLALIPALALRLPTKKIAAGLALGVAAVYLALSGGNVSTERAFIMVAVALCAVMLERRAFSLRAVAIAALIVLCLRPEALMGPGFQMSFAATAALVAVFGWLRDSQITLGPKWCRPVVAVVISSAVAGAATAPIGAAHFNTISHYGLIANLLSVPLMGVLVIPAAVLALCLAPIGLEVIGLWAMGLGLRWILGVAHWITGLEGARGFVSGPDVAVLPLMALGLLFVILWQGRARWIGVAPALAALVLWVQSERPVALIADTGGLVGVMTGQGRALSKPRGAGFIALNWLENDGDGASQEQAAIRWKEGVDRARTTSIGGIPLTHLIGKKAAMAAADCVAGEIIVVSVTPVDRGPCQLFGPDRLRQTGSVALYYGKDGLRIVTAKDMTGSRLWNTRPKRSSKWSADAAN